MDQIGVLSEVAPYAEKNLVETWEAELVAPTQRHGYTYLDDGGAAQASKQLLVGDGS
jgi:hypothetical protein